MRDGANTNVNETFKLKMLAATKQKQTKLTTKLRKYFDETFDGEKSCDASAPSEPSARCGPSAGQLRRARISQLESVPHNHVGPTDVPKGQSHR